MKRAILVLMILGSFLLAGCRKTNDAECNSTWWEMTNTIDSSLLSTSAIVNLVMDQHMLPNTVGAYIQQCLEEGWRPGGL